MLVTHYHWDHIQGMPFFHPFFEARNRFHFYSFQSKYLGPDSLRQVLEAQLAKPVFSGGREHDDGGAEFREISGGEKWEINGNEDHRSLAEPSAGLPGIQAGHTGRFSGLRHR